VATTAIAKTGSEGGLPPWALERLTNEQRGILNTEDVKEVLLWMVQRVANLAQNIFDLAVGYYQLRRLGVPREEIHIDIPYIEQVAVGQVLPELVAKLAGRPRLLQRAAALPLGEQRRFADDEPVKVMEPGGDFRMVQPSLMTSLQVSQVFAGDHLRNEAEQMQWLSDRRKLQEAGEVDEEPVRILSHEVVIVRPVRLTLSRLRALVKELERKSRGG